jgi:cytochrome c oxidase cbb3-type subunit 3
LFTTIRYGVPTKGMIAWKDQLKPEQIQAVASYILTLQGTNPEGALPPQGERYVPEEDSPEGEDAANPDGESPDGEAQPADAGTETAEAEEATPQSTASL